VAVDISGKVLLYDAAGTEIPFESPPTVYLQPSRTNFFYTTDGGTTWIPWQGDPVLKETHPGAIAKVCNSSGDWTFTIPWTDTECVSGTPNPPLLWNIIDPNPATGTVVYTGPTPASIVGAASTLKDLITLAAPSTWQVSGEAYTGYPVGDRRVTTVSFTAASSTLTAGATWPAMAAATWKANLGIRTDDTSGASYTAQVDDTTRTTTGCNIVLSGLPPAGATVYVDIEAIP
jgi:hypothetical protein